MYRLFNLAQRVKVFKRSLADGARRERLNSLAASGGFCLLAADHETTEGPVNGLGGSKYARLVADSVERSYSGMVVPVGIAEQPEVRRAFQRTAQNLVVQLVGLPNNESNLNKVALGSVEDALSLGATAVSVQLDFSSSNFPDAFKTINSLKSEAHNKGLPVLLMINYDKNWENFLKVLSSTATNGFDLIKISYPEKPEDGPSEELKMNIETRLNDPAFPPVLLAGGALPEDAGKVEKTFKQTLEKAVGLGFKGICVGRIEFQGKIQKSPPSILKELLAKINPPKPKENFGPTRVGRVVLTLRRTVGAINGQ